MSDELAQIRADAPCGCIEEIGGHLCVRCDCGKPEDAARAQSYLDGIKQKHTERLLDHAEREIDALQAQRDALRDAIEQIGNAPRDTGLQWFQILQREGIDYPTAIGGDDEQSK